MRYLIFGSEEFYSSGGWNDFIASCSSKDMAIIQAKKEIGNEYYRAKDKEELENKDWLLTETIEWVQVVDILTMKVIFTEGAPYGFKTPFKEICLEE